MKVIEEEKDQNTKRESMHAKRSARQSKMKSSERSNKRSKSKKKVSINLEPEQVTPVQIKPESADGPEGLKEEVKDESMIEQLKSASPRRSPRKSNLMDASMHSLAISLYDYNENADLNVTSQRFNQMNRGQGTVPPLAISDIEESTLNFYKEMATWYRK